MNDLWIELLKELDKVDSETNEILIKSGYTGTLLKMINPREILDELALNKK